MTHEKAKKFVFDHVESNGEAIALLCDNIFYFAELGMQEFDATPACSQKSGVTDNDFGEVSWVVPTGLITFPSNVPGVSYHHWSAGVALATSIAHKGAVAGAKAMAASAVDLLMAPSLVAKAKQSFKNEIGDVEYRPLLPPDQKPPLELNRDIMERYRPAMREHYLKDKPVFI